MQYFLIIFKTIVVYFLSNLFNKYFLKREKAIFNTYFFVGYLFLILSLWIIDIKISFINIFLSIIIFLGLYVFEKYYVLNTLKAIIKKGSNNPITLISNGKINFYNLKAIDKDLLWLNSSLNEDIKNISYAFYQDKMIYVIKEKFN